MSSDMRRCKLSHCYAYDVASWYLFKFIALTFLPRQSTAERSSRRVQGGI